MGICNHILLYFIYLFWGSILLSSSGRPWTLGYSPASVLTDCAPVLLLYGSTMKGLSLDMEEALPHGLLSEFTVIIAYMCVLPIHVCLWVTGSILYRRLRLNKFPRSLCRLMISLSEKPGLLLGLGQASACLICSLFCQTTWLTTTCFDRFLCAQGET